MLKSKFNTQKQEANRKERRTEERGKKRIPLKYVIVGVLGFMVLSSAVTNSKPRPVTTTTVKEVVKKEEQAKPLTPEQIAAEELEAQRKQVEVVEVKGITLEEADENFISPTLIPNNKSNLPWKLTRLSTDVKAQEYALDFYNRFMDGNNEVHFVANFKLGTINQVREAGEFIVLEVSEFVKGTENDSTTINNGELYEMYEIEKATGEVHELNIETLERK